MTKITQDIVKGYLDYDPDTGIFKWKNKNKTAGTINGKYIQLGIEYKKYYAHRIAWLYVYGYIPEKEIDHINGDSKDNRICNLREVDRCGNMQNIKKVKGNKINKCNSIGVTYIKYRKKYRAMIGFGGCNLFLGYFDTEEQAKLEYDRAKEVYHTKGWI